MAKTFNSEQVYFVIAAILSLITIIHLGPLTYFLITASYILIQQIKIEWYNAMDPSHPHRKLFGWLKGCFALGNDVWLDPSLSDIFSALQKYCKPRKLKVIIFFEQLEAIARLYDTASEDSQDFKNAKEAINRIESMQKGGVLRILPPIEGHKYDIPKLQFFEALTYYAKKCPSAGYLSKDPEIRIRVRHFLENNSDVKINIIPIGDFQKAADYINRFKISSIDKLWNVVIAPKKKLDEKVKKVKTKKEQIKDFVILSAALAKKDKLHK